MARSRRTKLIIAAATLPIAAMAMAISATASASSLATNSFPAHFAAPYLELSTSTAGDMAADMSATGGDDDVAARRLQCVDL